MNNSKLLKLKPVKDNIETCPDNETSSITTEHELNKKLAI